jgi:hypothetical protein
MKTKIIVLAIAILFPLIGFSQSKCEKFKNGTFKFTDPKSKKVCVITRNGNIQTEKMQDAEEVYDFDVVWLDDCTYTVTPTAATSARNKDATKIGTMTVKMVQIKDSSYVQKISIANNRRFKRSDTVFVMNE